MKNFKRKLSAVLLTASIFTLAACAPEEAEVEETAAPTGVAVTTEFVAASDISSENKVSGQVLATGETSIFASANIKVTEVYAEAGDTVSAGEVICTLDMDGTIASYNASNINYNSTVQSYNDQKAIFDKQVALNEKNLNDLKALFEIGAASQMEIETAELTLMSTRAQRTSTLAQLEAGMQNARSSVEQLSVVMENVDGYGNVIAPVSGTLVSLSAVEGGFTTGQGPLAVIDGAERMEISVSVSEALVPKLNIGGEALVVVSAIDQSFSGTILSIEKTADPQTRLYEIIVSAPADIDGLLAGMFADVTFPTNTSLNAIVIPSEAILTENDKEYVYRVISAIATKTEVTTGLTGSGVTEIITGLTVGDQIVTVGQDYIADGDLVRVVSSDEAE